MKHAWRRRERDASGRLLVGVFLLSALLVMLALVPAHARAESWDLRGFLAEAEAARKGGDRHRARGRYEICLNLAPIDGSVWQTAFLSALDDHPDLLEVLLFSSDKEVVPLSTLPEGDLDRDRTTLFPIPVSYPSNDFLGGYRDRRLVEQMFRDGNERAGLEQLEALLEQEPENLRLLIYLGYLYERRERLDLAWDRYEEGLGKATLEEDRFSLLYSLFRVRYKEGKVAEAQDMLRRFVADARNEVGGAARAVKGVEKPSESQLTRLIEAQRRLVLGLNLEGLFTAAHSDLVDAAPFFEEALSLNPGRIPLRLNVNKTVVARNMIATAPCGTESHPGRPREDEGRRGPQGRTCGTRLGAREALRPLPGSSGRISGPAAPAPRPRRIRSGSASRELGVCSKSASVSTGRSPWPTTFSARSRRAPRGSARPSSTTGRPWTWPRTNRIWPRSSGSASTGSSGIRRRNSRRSVLSRAVGRRLSRTRRATSPSRTSGRISKRHGG